MRKAFSYCIGLLSLASAAHAQTPAVQSWTGFYIGANAGYAWSHAGDMYSGNGFVSQPINGTETYNTTTGIRTYDFNKASYGSGAAVTLRAGYMFNPHIGVDLGFRAGLAPKVYTYEYIQTAPAGNITETYTTRVNGQFAISPSLLLSTGSDNKLFAYTRLGLDFPLGGDMLEEYLRENDILDVDDLTDEEYDFFSAKGLLGEIGVGYNLNDRLSVMVQVGGTSRIGATKSSEVTRAQSNGVDELSLWDTDQKMTEYSSNFTYDPVTQTATVPGKGSTYTAPFGRVYGDVGLTFKLNNDMRIRARNTEGGSSVPKAESSIYARIGVGYTMPHAGNFYISDGFFSAPVNGTRSYNNGTNITTIDYKKASYSAGVNLDVAGGYMFTPNFGAELGLRAGLAPATYTYNDSYIDTMGTISQENETKANMPVYVTPAIIISTGADQPFSVYSRVGISLPIGGKLTRTYTENNSITGDITNETEEYKFFMSKALTGALGGRYALGPNFGLWGEISGSSMTRYTRSSTITQYSVNGVDMLGSATTSQKETMYDFNFTSDPSTFSTAQPTQRTPITMPFSNWGISFGVDMRF